MRQLQFSEDKNHVDLRGTLEHIIFHNEENGYTVFRMRPGNRDEEDSIVIVGNMINPQTGGEVHITGHWVNNPKFGRQLQMESYENLMPTTEEGIELYLASGLIKGIGPRIAKRIVYEFGLDTLKIFDDDPDHLLSIKGITQPKLEQIKESWEEHKGIRDLVQFLQPHDIGISYAIRIYKQYHAESLKIVQNNPYRLAMDISGIGFLTADSLATKLGFKKDDPLRAEAGTLYTLIKQSEDGNVYYPLDQLIEVTSTQLDIDKELVQDAIEKLSLEKRVVIEELDGIKAVYRSYFYTYESQIAFYLQKILSSPPSLPFPDANEVIDHVVNELDITLAEEQLKAVQTSTKAKIMILTGGPGTGKTTILNAIIRVFSANKAKILLAAPTGRAAKRMSEAIGREAKTIHRLLEFSPKEDGFTRNEDNPLVCNLLVIDEASMMDTMLAYYLLKATPSGATLIFVGDIHQLPSVGPGNVLGDLIDSRVIPVVELVEVFRQAETSAIITNAHKINRGEIPHLVFSKDHLSDFYFIRQDDPEKVLDIILKLVKENIPKRFHLDPVNDIQVMTPMHKGVVGSANLNFCLQNVLNPNKLELQRGEKHFRLNDKVMQIRNNYEKDIYNGDIGRISWVDREEKQITVKFDEDHVIDYTWEDLDDIVPAYAISIHKSQGSEYPAVVMPIMTQHYILLQRNLIYTGVTRGKKLVVVVGDPKALIIAIKNNRTLKRYTWLAHRLAKALPAQRSCQLPLPKGSGLREL